MIKVLFICHGNICRSPMAEFVMKALVKKAGLEKNFQIASAATSTEEIGNPVYPPARRKLAEHGISCDGHSARQLTDRDYEEYDFLIGMDQANLRNMRRICGEDRAGKMHLLLSFAGRQKGLSATPDAVLERREGSGRSFRLRRKRRKARAVAAKWPTRGIRAILRRLGGMCWRAARDCLNLQRKRGRSAVAPAQKDPRRFLKRWLFER